MHKKLIACIIFSCACASGAYAQNTDGPALAALMQRAALADSHGADEAIEAEIANMKSSSPAIERFINWTKAHQAQRMTAGSASQSAQPGSVTSFLVSFPFEAASMFDFDRAFPPENGYDTSQNTEGAMYPALSWVPYESTGNQGAIRPQERVYNPGYATMFLATRIVIDGTKPVEADIEIPASTPVVAWLNQKRVVHAVEKGPVPAPKFGERWPITLQPGENVLTIKTASLEEEPGFYVFISDRNGKPLNFKTDISKPIVSEKLGTDKPDTPRQSVLYPILTDEKASPALRAFIAREILPQDDAERRINDLLFSDLDATAAMTPDELELAILALNNHAKSLQFLSRAMKRFPNDPRMTLIYARQMILASEDQGDSGARFVDEWPQIRKTLENLKAPTVNGISYEPLRRKLLALAELNGQQAFTAMKDMLADTQSCPTCERYLIPLVMGALSERKLTAEYQRYLGMLLEHDKNASAYLTDYLEGRLKRAVSANDNNVLADELATIQKAADRFFEVHPNDDYFWKFWLNLVSEYGTDAPRANNRAYRDALERAHFTADAASQFMIYLSTRVNDPNRWSFFAEHSLKTGDYAEAIAAYEMALKLEPQNEILTNKLQTLKLLANHQEADNAQKGKTEAFEAPYEIADIPKNRDKNAVGLVSLLDNRVVRILPNGMSSTYNQIAFEILDEQGLKAVRAMPINYSPNDEKLEIISVRTQKKDGSTRTLYNKSEYNMADESIRMYYDQRQVVIEVPDLAVGDIIEYKFKKTQTQISAGSVAYFSDIYQLQQWFTRQWSRYTVIAPANLPVRFFRHDPKGATETPVTTKTVDGNTVTIFEEKDTPRFIAEAQMPGATEVMPFLLVSTFDSWQDMTNWYIDLALPQWKADDAIRAKVRELTDDISDPFEKLKKIHSFVVKNTRYVALEFGIHGHKPYPVSQIFERRFGDCKDKASLLKVMLKEAGIDSEFVLARTRQNGDISTELATPYMFDHAILYVPQFDLFLDGTAEFSGTRELPALDQDAWALIVTDDAHYTLRKIPVSKASENVTHLIYSMDLTTKDELKYSLSADYSGYFAPSYRERYQIENLQRERLESEIAYAIPGTKIDTFSMSDLTDLERDVHLDLSASTSFTDIVKTDGSTWLVYPALAPAGMVHNFAPTASRKLPLILPVPLTFQKEVTLKLPQGARVVLPDDLNESSSFGKFSISARRDGDQITTKASLALDTIKISPENYTAFIDFLQKYDRRMNTQYRIDF
ncbi:MAG: DUF3857 domain-containing protein [Proteobacteria bacterium]|nr:DUF3857 domain-containing protein [Pseudomonadota bacterium]